MRLTEREFWLSYWENKENLAFEIKEDYIFSEFLKKFCQQQTIKNGIELGGFPGYYAVFLKKWLKTEAALFDYVIHPVIIESVLNKNHLQKTDIELIEADLFDFEPSKKYDLVMSFGLIEHFEDTKEIILQHLKFLNPKGRLFVTLPNFQGLNGWFQKNFDNENYLKHNISCMDLKFLQKTVDELGLHEIEVTYHGRFMIWLENMNTKGLFFRLCFKSVWFLLKGFTKILPFESRFLSPFIVISAKSK